MTPLLFCVLAFLVSSSVVFKVGVLLSFSVLYLFILFLQLFSQFNNLVKYFTMFTIIYYGQSYDTKV